jgi:hypothetical protein
MSGIVDAAGGDGGGADELQAASTQNNKTDRTFIRAPLSQRQSIVASTSAFASPGFVATGAAYIASAYEAAICSISRPAG